MRFPIRAKLSIMTMASIAIAVLTLGISLIISFNVAAYNTAAETLAGASRTATLALQNSITSIETSMNLLSNQIGYNHDFANNILDFANSQDANNAVKKSLAGSDNSSDGSTIIGAMDYMVVSDKNIKSATMYSPFVNTAVYQRLFPTTESQIECTEERYNTLLNRPGKALWFFKGNDELYVWKAIVNYGVVDAYNMQVVGYVEYGFNRSTFLNVLVETQYENEGMYLFDAQGNKVLDVSCGMTNVDKMVYDSYKDLNSGLFRVNEYTSFKSHVDLEDWNFVSFINHSSVEKTTRDGGILVGIIVGASVIVAALVAFFLSSREIKRIKNLSKAASSISSGDYNIRLEKKSNDEITDVSESFNTMAGKIQDVLNELILQQDSISENFATILSNKSGESGNHVKRVSEYSAILAEELGFNENDVHDIRIASMLHDVGKIMVDENILHKPGRFTDEEYKIMQQHVVYGGQLLNGVPGNIMKLGAIIAEYHHERWDGNGYVKHLKGDEIPKEAQITSVADVFDALVSKRCYKSPWSIEDAYNEIVNQRGKQFAPDVVDAFVKRFEDFKRVAEIYKED